MTIPVRCACGNLLQAKDEWAGRRVKCPKCGAAVLIQRPASARVPAQSPTDSLFDEAFPAGTGRGESPFAQTPVSAQTSSRSEPKRGWFGWLFWKFPSWGSALKWNEPILYRIRLRGDVLLRLIVVFAAWGGGTGLFLALFAINKNPPGIALGLGLGAIFGGLGMMAMFLGRSQVSGRVSVRESSIHRDRMYVKFTLFGGWHEWAEFPFSRIRRCVIVPAGALGKPFSVMTLLVGAEQEIIGIPSSIDLEDLKRRLSAAGLSVELGRTVPTRYTQPLSLMIPLITGAICAASFLVGLGFYLVNTSDDGPRQVRAERARKAHLEHMQEMDQQMAPNRRPPDSGLPGSIAGSQSPVVLGNSGRSRSAPASDNKSTPRSSNTRGRNGQVRPGFDGPPFGFPGGRFGPGRRPPLPGSATDSQPGDTHLVGGSGGAPFRYSSPTGQPVVGFRFVIGSWAGKDAIQVLMPAYDRAATGTDPQTVTAREGYAVGAIMVAADQLVEAIQVEFMRITPQGLDTADTYLSEWIGTPGDIAPEKLGGTGVPVIGVHGRKGAVMDSIGLVMQQ